MAGTKIAKKLPKRTSNANSKARRARSWAAGQRRKAARNAAQEQRHNENLARGYTVWDHVKALRANARG